MLYITFIAKPLEMLLFYILNVGKKFLILQRWDISIFVNMYKYTDGFIEKTTGLLKKGQELFRWLIHSS